MGVTCIDVRIPPVNAGVEHGSLAVVTAAGLRRPSVRGLREVRMRRWMPILRGAGARWTPSISSRPFVPHGTYVEHPAEGAGGQQAL